MGFFKSISKAVHKVSSFANHAAHDTKSVFDHVNKATTNLFDHGKIGKHHLFGKDSIGSHVLRDVSKGSSAVGSALGSAGAHLSKFANSGVVGEVLGATPLGSNIQKGLTAVATGLQAGKGIAKGVSTLTKQKNYSGGPAQVVSQVNKNVRAMLPQN
jgi:hypothetical protein